MTEHNQYMNIELMRFITAGSVDDGKSTLIGRLMYDTKSIFDDQLASIKNASNRKGLSYTDLSMLTDGLKDEREQGITIDVAYRFFTTPKRKFIIADTPGHIQYTRNMVTGASTANAALILIDAKTGLTEQTHRHSFITSLLQIPHIIVCINKMDLVDYSESVFTNIIKDYTMYATNLDVRDIQFVPISALHGDNVFTQSENMNWYKGSTLLHMLEHLDIAKDNSPIDIRFPIQTTIRASTATKHNFRGYAGKMAGGTLKKNEAVMVLPSGQTSTVKSIYIYDKEIEEAFAAQSIIIELNDDIDVSRGDMIVSPNNLPYITQELDVTICWLSNETIRLNRKYILRHTENEVRATVKEVLYLINIETLKKEQAKTDINTNDIARVKLKTSAPVFADAYRKNRYTGSFILIDEATNETIAAGIIM